HTVAGREGQRVGAGSAGSRGTAQDARRRVKRHTARQGAGLAQRRRRHAGGGHGEAARASDREGGVIGAADGGRLIDRERERLGGRAADAVTGGEGQGICAGGAGGGRAGQDAARGVEGDAAGQSTRFAQGWRREAGGRHREAACTAHGEGSV